MAGAWQWPNSAVARAVERVIACCSGQSGTHTAKCSCGCGSSLNHSPLPKWAPGCFQEFGFSCSVFLLFATGCLAWIT
jgi:hypothetical protein